MPPKKPTKKGERPPAAPGEAFLALSPGGRVTSALGSGLAASAVLGFISAAIAVTPGPSKPVRAAIVFGAALAAGTAAVAVLSLLAERLRSRGGAAGLGFAAGATQYAAAAGTAALLGGLRDDALWLGLVPIGLATIGGALMSEALFPAGDAPADDGPRPHPVVRALFSLGRALHAMRRNRDAERVAEAAAEPFPAAWEEILARNVALSRHLDGDERARLHALVRLFLEDVSMEGAGGLELTDEIRVTIAGQACMLLLRLDLDGYPDVRSVVVYPSTYVAQRRSADGEMAEGPHAVLGESWGRGGVVVLSWDSARGGAANPTDGHNVVLHEFAHQLDQEDGSADGIPYLPDWPTHVEWARLLAGHHALLRRDVRAGRKTVMDEYGATNPAEFFAVATECFFERPAQMRRAHPALYDELHEYFGQDPASWPSRETAREAAT
jgi:Mlc titration factor MtfA (ptsG expression regulator)